MPMRRSTGGRGPGSWVVYRTVVRGEVTGPTGVCEQAELDEMERLRPGSTFVVQAGIADEGVAERLARGTSGDAKPRLTRETAARPGGGPVSPGSGT